MSSKRTNGIGVGIMLFLRYMLLAFACGALIITTLVAHGTSTLPFERLDILLIVNILSLVIFCVFGINGVMKWNKEDWR